MRTPYGCADFQYSPIVTAGCHRYASTSEEELEDEEAELEEAGLEEAGLEEAGLEEAGLAEAQHEDSVSEEDEAGDSPDEGLCIALGSGLVSLCYINSLAL